MLDIIVAEMCKGINPYSVNAVLARIYNGEEIDERMLNIGEGLEKCLFGILLSYIEAGASDKSDEDFWKVIQGLVMYHNILMAAKGESEFLVLPEGIPGALKIVEIPLKSKVDFDL